MIFMKQTDNRQMFFRAGKWRDGYWEDASDDGKFVIPIPRKNKWKGQEAFLIKLSGAQDKADKVYYKGYSTCRICHKKNGSSSYVLGGWEWPCGLEHYIEAHNVRPTNDFIHFIMNH